MGAAAVIDPEPLEHLQRPGSAPRLLDGLLGADRRRRVSASASASFAHRVLHALERSGMRAVPI
jgi:hypothetical protein